eukprot:TRINITY_DN1087_c0_g1_i1.p1 TRINITY_DN1087_c0_g1~~TRINITY_DN1087_c0_g1_i1.p1  ORF type:complete len:796 (-),score=97.69 TRINITY_DN1087_c0_g1_i1:2456-4753(-)
MQVKRERTHQCGLSNIDFKRLDDRNNLKRYSDDMRCTNFGLMGRTGVPYAFESCGFGNRQSLQVHSGFKVPEPPNPRHAEIRRHYENVKKPFTLPSDVQRKRVSQLESQVWNEKVFTGEDVGHLTWYNSQISSPKDVLASTQGPGGAIRSIVSVQKQNIGIMRKGDKLDKHEKAIQETQLVKVKNKETLEGKVDIQKVKEIRRAIRRRYGNRSNYHKIFNSWDRHRKGYIDLTDLHYMINKLGISINTQEARVLMASHDHTGNQKLNMEGFMDLIFSANDNMNVDLSKMKFNASVLEIEPNEDVMEKIQKDAAKLRKIREENSLKYILQKSLKDLYKAFKEKDEEKTGEIDYEGFENAITSKVQLPGYIKDNKDLFLNVFKELDEKKTGKVNYQKFCEGLKTFRYVGETDVNIDLGPSKEQRVEVANTEYEKKVENHMHIYDVQKVPANHLARIVSKTLKVSRIIQAKYGTTEKFDQELKEKLKFDEYGNVHSQQLEEYLLNVCKDQLIKRELDRGDLEGFLSALVYNKHKTTDINSLAPLVFSDDTQISKKIYSLQRPMPPPTDISKNAFSGIEAPEEVSNDRMREIVKELQLKSFADKKHIFHIFRDYDKDGDGYISYIDIKEQFKKLKIPATNGEIKRFIDLVDGSKKGYLDFQGFASTITPNMADQLTPLPDNEETYLYKRDRLNLVPNAEKIRENLTFHKTFTNKFTEIRDKLLPDKNMVLSNFLCNLSKIWSQQRDSEQIRRHPILFSISSLLPHQLCT